MYEIEPIKSKPDRVRITRRRKYPFNELTVGMSFTVPAEVADQFRHVRVAASDYARRNDVRIRCNVQADGSMIVWRDKDNGSTVEQPSTKPSKFEFVSYLATMQLNQSFTLKSEFSSRFEQFGTWIDEYEQGSTMRYSVDGDSSTLTIARIE